MFNTISVCGLKYWRSKHNYKKYFCFVFEDSSFHWNRTLLQLIIFLSCKDIFPSVGNIPPWRWRVSPYSRGSAPSSSARCPSRQTDRTCCRSNQAGRCYCLTVLLCYIKTSHHDSAWKLLIRKGRNVHVVRHQSAYLVTFPPPGPALRWPHGAPLVAKSLTFLADEASLSGGADWTLYPLLFGKDKVGLGGSVLPLLWGQPDSTGESVLLASTKSRKSRGKREVFYCK